MIDSEIKNIFKDFVGREENLRGITRYDGYPVMFYRSQLYTHAKHIAWLLEATAPYIKSFFPQFDLQRAIFMGLIHDDPEIVMGDIQAGYKAKMTPAQLAEVDVMEQAAVVKIVQRFPKEVGRYSYEALLRESIEKQTVEAQIMKLMDKLDAQGEALNELYAGNYVFSVNRVNEYGVIPTPIEYYINYISEFMNSYRQISPLFSSEHPVFRVPAIFDESALAQRGKPHTLESLRQSTDHPFYNFWKATILKSGDEEEIQNLYMQKEFLPV